MTCNIRSRPRGASASEPSLWFTPRHDMLPKLIDPLVQLVAVAVIDADRATAVAKLLGVCVQPNLRRIRSGVVMDWPKSTLHGRSRSRLAVTFLSIF